MVSITVDQALDYTVAPRQQPSGHKHRRAIQLQAIAERAEVLNSFKQHRGRISELTREFKGEATIGSAQSPALQFYKHLAEPVPDNSIPESHHARNQLQLAKLKGLSTTHGKGGGTMSRKMIIPSFNSEDPIGNLIDHSKTDTSVVTTFRNGRILPSCYGHIEDAQPRALPRGPMEQIDSYTRRTDAESKPWTIVLTSPAGVTDTHDCDASKIDPSLTGLSLDSLKKSQNEVSLATKLGMSGELADDQDVCEGVFTRVRRKLRARAVKTLNIPAEEAHELFRNPEAVLDRLMEKLNCIAVSESNGEQLVPEDVNERSETRRQISLRRQKILPKSEISYMNRGDIEMSAIYPSSQEGHVKFSNESTYVSTKYRKFTPSAEESDIFCSRGHLTHPASLDEHENFCDEFPDCFTRSQEGDFVESQDILGADELLETGRQNVGISLWPNAFSFQSPAQGSLTGIEELESSEDENQHPKDVEDLQTQHGFFDLEEFLQSRSLAMCVSASLEFPLMNFSDDEDEPKNYLEDARAQCLDKYCRYEPKKENFDYEFDELPGPLCRSIGVLLAWPNYADPSPWGFHSVGVHETLSDDQCAETLNRLYDVEDGDSLEENDDVEIPGSWYGGIGLVIWPDDHLPAVGCTDVRDDQMVADHEWHDNYPQSPVRVESLIFRSTNFSDSEFIAACTRSSDISTIQRTRSFDWLDETRGSSSGSYEDVCGEISSSICPSSPTS